MTASIDNARDGVDEAVTGHASINELVQFIDVVPAANVIGLERFYPVEHT